MRNEIKYIMLQQHTDEMLETMRDFTPPVVPHVSQWIDMEKIIKDIPKLDVEFYNAEMIVHAYDMLLWQTALGIITREKLTEFIDALAESSLFPPIVDFIISIHKKF